MEPHIVALVLVAAVLHAGWNALVRGTADRLVVMALLAATGALISLVAIPFLPLPAAPSWPYIVASTCLHVGYQFFLIAAYRYGDLAHVYPIARGAAPVLTAAAAWLFVGQALPGATVAGIALIAAGLMSLSLRGGEVIRHDRRAGLYALGTACFIAAYTVCDGLGVARAGNPHAYTVWLFLLEGIALVVIVARRRAGTLSAPVARHWRAGVVAGSMTIAAYWLVLWALSQSAIAPVAALRETSVIFAAIIGALFLKEPMDRRRVAAAILVVAGVALMQL